MERDVRNVGTIHRALHRRQFVLDREPHKIHDDWVVVQLANGFTLSHCPDLEVTRALDADSRQWIVLGNAFDLDNEYRGAELSISRLPSQNIPCSTYSWAGRWALIGLSVIIPDASACLGLFHYRSTTGRLLVSSSLSILTRLVRESGLDPVIEVTPRVITRGINWVPPPCTNADPIRKLLPDQTLSLTDGQPLQLVRLSPHGYAPLSTLERARLLSDYLIGILRSLAAEQRPIVIALTAGLDSRCALACALRAGLKFETVTAGHSRITTADREIPIEIAKRYGFSHRYIRGGSHLTRSDKNVIYRHTFYRFTDPGGTIAEWHLWPTLPSSMYLVRSNFWELGKEPYYLTKRVDLSQFLREPRILSKSYPNFGSTASTSRQFQEWVRWRSERLEGYSWNAAYYRDQRLGGWLSWNEQALDMLDGRSVQPINSCKIFDILVSEEESLREKATVQYELLRLSETGLEGFPINPPDGFAKTHLFRWRRRLEIVVAETTNLLTNSIG